jgi:LmbE family N-acetylglucosaminyl deacetylase
MNTLELETLRILAVGAHPDDIEFGCGGVLLIEAAAGAEITLVITSRGEAGSSGTPAQREAESLAAAELLGAATRLSILDFGGDGQQRDCPENAIQLARQIRKCMPTMVLAPVPESNQHPDHTVVGAVTRNACRLARYGGLESLQGLAPHEISSLWYYAIAPTTKEGAVYVDITVVAEKWKALMECHATQVKSRNYLDLQFARARQAGLLAGCEYALALWPNDPPVLDRLSRLPRGARAF